MTGETPVSRPVALIGKSHVMIPRDVLGFVRHIMMSLDLHLRIAQTKGVKPLNREHHGSFSK